MSIISFDVFDTAIRRTVYEPVDIFTLIEEKIGRNFKNRRIEAEKKACKEFRFYNIQDIYTFLPDFDYATEVAVELENCIPNQEILSLYNKYINEGKKVIFISDMYLSAKNIEAMLEKCGYSSPKVYVSCELKASKSTGILFNKVENIEGKILKHYGDNYTADIKGGIKANILTEYIPAVRDVKHSVIDINNKKLKQFLVLNEMSEKSIELKVATYWSTLIFAYTKWILDSRIPEQRIFFNSRDGYLPYLIAKNIFKAKDVYYLHSSRKSLLHAAINTKKDLLDEENLFLLDRIGIFRMHSKDEFIETYNYEGDELEEAENMRDLLLLNKDKLYPFFNKCKENAKKYFNKMGVRDNDIFADIGFYGSLQYSIEKIAGIKLKGYYAQSIPQFNINIERYSYFKKPRVLNYFMMFETVWASPEDGIRGYDDEANVLHYPDNNERKKFATKMNKQVLESVQYLYNNSIFPSEKDLEDLMIRFIYYPTIEECYYCNNKMWENGNASNFESVVNYDVEKIKAGGIEECYKDSYWKPAFLIRLENDKELKHLRKFLNIE